VGELGKDSCRLPREYAWEYAAKAGTPSDWDYWWHESDFDSSKCNADRNEGCTTPPSDAQANPWGLRDMLGNVQEWCDDWYRRKYSRDATDQTSAGVLRGASWGSDAVVRRSSFRNYSPPTTRNYLVGFTTTPVPIKSVKRRKLPLDRRLHLKRLRMRMRALKGFALPPAAPRCPSSGLVELAFFRTAEPKAPQLAPRGCKAPISWPERTAEVHRTAAGWGRPRQFDPMFDRAQEEETEGSFRRFD
jgi:hypothetical protein